MHHAVGARQRSVQVRHLRDMDNKARACHRRAKLCNYAAHLELSLPLLSVAAGLTWLTTALTWLPSRAAMVMTWPPANDVPHRLSLLVSTLDAKSPCT